MRALWVGGLCPNLMISWFFFYLQDNSAGINFSCSFLCSCLSLLSVQITFTTDWRKEKDMSNRVNQFILHIFMAIKSSLWFCVLLMTYFTLRKSYKLFQFTMLLLCCVCRKFLVFILQNHSVSSMCKGMQLLIVSMENGNYFEHNCKADAY